jgi:hypothetical protein
MIQGKREGSGFPATILQISNEGGTPPAGGGESRIPDWRNELFSSPKKWYDKVTYEDKNHQNQVNAATPG